MRKRLQLALMSSPIIATFLSLTPEPAQAADDGCHSQGLTAVTDDTGKRQSGSISMARAEQCSSERKPE